MTTAVRNLRPTLTESLYVLMVAVPAIAGFTAGSAPVILLAALLSLPSSVLAVPAYYVAYGLLGMVPGANPSSGSGSGSCTPNGDCVTSTTGELAPWFAITSEAIGILALVAAALVNVHSFGASTIAAPPASNRRVSTESLEVRLDDSPMTCRPARSRGVGCGGCSRRCCGGSCRDCRPPPRQLKRRYAGPA